MDVLAVFAISAVVLYYPLYKALDRAFPPSGKPKRLRPSASSFAGAALFDAIAGRSDWIVLDVETTGLTKSSEIIEIAIVDAAGAVLLERTVMPKGRIPRSASKAHGLTRRKLKGSPGWPEIDAKVRRLLAGKLVLAYNAEYETRLLNQTAAKWGLPPVPAAIQCLMLAYAEHRGIRHQWREGEFKWHKMQAACRHEGIALEQDHRARADAEMARQLAIAVARSRAEADRPPWIESWRTV